MALKIRKQIYFEANQNRKIKRQAKAQGVSEAELVCRAVDALPQSTGKALNPSAFEIFDALARKRQALGPIKGGRRWKREDLYEERLARYGKQISD